MVIILWDPLRKPHPPGQDPFLSLLHFVSCPISLPPWNGGKRVVSFGLVRLHKAAVPLCSSRLTSLAFHLNSKGKLLPRSQTLWTIAC